MRCVILDSKVIIRPQVCKHMLHQAGLAMQNESMGLPVPELVRISRQQQQSITSNVGPSAFRVQDPWEPSSCMLMKLAQLPPESWVPKKAQETTGSGWRGPAWLSAAAAPRLYQNRDMPQDCHLLVVSGHCISFQRKGPWVEQQKRLDHQVTQPLLSLKTALEGIFCPRSHWPQHRTVVLEPVM